MRDDSSTTNLLALAHVRFAMRCLLLPSILTSVCYGQFGSPNSQINSAANNSGIQPYVPEVVGGLPPNSSGLEQPVFVNSKNDSGAVSSQAFSSYLESERESQAFHNSIQERVIQAPEINYQEFVAGTRVAVVGSEPILLSDVFQQRELKKLPPPGVDESTRKKYDDELRRRLKEIIVRKALYQRFFEMQVAGKSNKDRETARIQINKKTTEMFYKDALPDIAKSAGLETVEEFYEGLAKEGKSIQAFQKNWAEHVISRECLRSGVDTDPKIELLEMKNYYEDNQEEFRQSAKVRFEVLTAEFSKYPNKQAAYDAIAEMGNQVYFGNALEAVAKQSSSGFAASQGGQVDWVSKGALKSKPLDAAAFSLPLRELSDIIEDSDAYHIVRVLERKDEMIMPFEDVQGEIKKKLAKKRTQESEKAFIDKVIKDTPIWTRWPEDFDGAMSISLLSQ